MSCIYISLWGSLTFKEFAFEKKNQTSAANSDLLHSGVKNGFREILQRGFQRTILCLCARSRSSQRGGILNSNKQSKLIACLPSTFIKNLDFNNNLAFIDAR